TQGDDAACGGRQAATPAAALGRNVEVAVGRDRQMARRTDVVGDDERAESLRQCDAAVIRIARDLRLAADAEGEPAHNRSRRHGHMRSQHSHLPTPRQYPPAQRNDVTDRAYMRSKKSEGVARWRRPSSRRRASRSANAFALHDVRKTLCGYLLIGIMMCAP